MAIVVPERPEDFHGSPGEREVLTALRDLPRGCYVFHSLNWLRRGGPRRPPEGEGDFVILDPTRGILVVEVKSGGIRLERGTWYQMNRQTGRERVIHPVQQANKTRHFLREHIEERLGKAVPVFHAVWFPSVAFPRAGLPPDCPAELVLDETALRDPVAGIARAFAFGSGTGGAAPIAGADFRKVLDIVAPTFSVVPSVRRSLADRERAFVQLTSEQARVLEFLEEQERAVVAGAAGTGKTMVALEHARRLAADGQDVLFLCFNRALRAYLQERHGAPRIDFHTFDSLAAERFPKLAGDFEAARGALLDALTAPGAPALPHVVIDEGQDFADDWMTVLAASTQGTFFVFYDRHQLVQREVVPVWIREAECRLVLRRNCRTTTQIARFAYRIAGLPPPPDTVDGPRPSLYLRPDGAAAAAVVGQVLQQLVGSRGLEPEEIAIVTGRTTEASSLPAFERVSGHPVSDVPRRGHVTWTTVRRFKGLEAKAVVLTDFTPAELVEPAARRLLYVGASRAMHELHVVLEGCQPQSVSDLAAALLGPGRKRNGHALAAELGATLIPEGEPC